ncbi:hypothetical protein WDU94_001780, partial [Cyamophila willieti]
MLPIFSSVFLLLCVPQLPSLQLSYQHSLHLFSLHVHTKLQSSLLDLLRHYTSVTFILFLMTSLISDPVQPRNSTTPPQHSHFRNFQSLFMNLLHRPRFSPIHHSRSHHGALFCTLFIFKFIFLSHNTYLHQSFSSSSSMLQPYVRSHNRVLLPCPPLIPSTYLNLSTTFTSSPFICRYSLSFIHYKVQLH